MFLTHGEWLAGVVVLASSAMFAVNSAVRKHVARRSAGRS